MPSVPDIPDPATAKHGLKQQLSLLEVGKGLFTANSRFLIALSGGDAGNLYRALTSPAFADRFGGPDHLLFSDGLCRAR
jgi:hypothetical protein